MASSEDVCVVCADPLDWTGFGACGHKEACSRCVARLRFVLDDARCVLCQTKNETVYFTRFMGDYTTRLAPDQFGGLKVWRCCVWMCVLALRRAARR